MNPASAEEEVGIPNPPFPHRSAHDRAWEELAEAIALAEVTVDEVPPASPPPASGELVIIGSGIETLGFALGDEELIRNADAVFYCVADPATVMWLKSIRPDAYDLYVLYDDGKVRYTTYMQMSEAMLHFVRRGKRVVAVYYGHPGVFVLSTHRSIMIARREGHRAVMRPGVSALDCLCADLGVDPCHPGLQTHEATDMLIRRRRPDTSLHVVLWQVGLIGEMGFRRKGYINDRFSTFIEYLQRFYGHDYLITHYIASRYPTIAPTIETYALQDLHEPRLQSCVTGVSTFYLAPRDPAEPDREMLIRLGLITPGQPLRTSDGPLREIGRYGPRERRAIAALRNFHTPRGYHWQEDTGASRFLVMLRHDPVLRQSYERDPHDTVRSFPGLTDRERSLLATRDAGAIQIAAKGTAKLCTENRAVLEALFKRKAVQVELLSRLRRSDLDNLVEVLAEWSRASGHPADWSRMRTDIDLACRTCLFPWTGIYRTMSPPNGQDANEEHLLVLTGDGRSARLSLDGEPIRRFSYKRGILEWVAGNNDLPNGFLQTDIDRHGRRRLIGSIWRGGRRAIPTDHRVVAVEVASGHRHPAALAGVYRRHTDEGSQRLEITVAAPIDTDGRDRYLKIVLNDAELKGPVDVAGRSLSVGPRCFLLDSLGGTGNNVAKLADWDEVGPPWRRDDGLPAALHGEYSVTMPGGLRRLRIDCDGIQLNDIPVTTWKWSRGQLTWADGPVEAPAGTVTLVLDPITLSPALFGTVKTRPGKDLRCHGVVPVSPDLRRTGPEFGLSATLWDRLVSLAARSDRAGGFLIWHQVEKANLAATIVHKLLARRLP